jgi:hypothetical protein
MNVDTLKEKLTDIDADTLRDFILDLYLRYPELSDKIEALTLADDPVALSRVLRKRIASLKRGRRFIDYRASFDFARELEADCWSAHRNMRLIWSTGSWRRQNRCSTVSMIPAGQWARYIARPY